MIAAASIATLSAFGQNMQMVKYSTITNILNLPVMAGPHGKVVSIKPPFANMPNGALCVSDIFVEEDTGRIVGGMGSCAYPTIAEGAFVMTNTIFKAVGEKTGYKAMVVPAHVNRSEGCMEMTYWWKPDPESAELELVVRGYSNKSRQLAVCTLLHTKGDDIRCGFRPPKKQPTD